jgi:2-aminoadipate transaminase
VLCDAGSRVLVETPTYLGALQAFSTFEPDIIPVASDDEGPLPAALDDTLRGARFMYVLPNYQNPSGHCYSEARRAALIGRLQALGVGIVEDNPYGDLWYDTPPPKALAGRWPDGVLYLGSFSKVLAPGLRLGYVVAPAPLYPKLLQAKQAADLHTPGFNQRIVHEVIRDGFLATHVPQIRARYAAQRDAMAGALKRSMPNGCAWNIPHGGMFFWVRLPAGVDALKLLPLAVRRGVAFVPGSAFYARAPEANTMRLSFVTVTPAEIVVAIERLAEVIREATVGRAAAAATAR